MPHSHDLKCLDFASGRWTCSVTGEATLTPAIAKKMIADKLAELGLSYTKLSSKTIGFHDLARVSRIFVTIHGWTPNPVADDLQKFAASKGFRVDFHAAPGILMVS